MGLQRVTAKSQARVPVDANPGSFTERQAARVARQGSPRQQSRTAPRPRRPQFVPLTGVEPDRERVDADEVEEPGVRLHVLVNEYDEIRDQHGNLMARRSRREPPLRPR
jgi:hypothetical protein